MLKKEQVDAVLQEKLGMTAEQYTDGAQEAARKNRPTFGLVVNDVSCNMSCRHCFMNAKPGGRDIPVEEIEKVMAIVRAQGFEHIRPHFTEMVNGDLDRHRRLLEVMG